jgi:hypothetical protein
MNNEKLLSMIATYVFPRYQISSSDIWRFLLTYIFLICGKIKYRRKRDQVLMHKFSLLFVPLERAAEWRLHV